MNWLLLTKLYEKWYEKKVFNEWMKKITLFILQDTFIKHFITPFCASQWKEEQSLNNKQIKNKI